MIQSGDSLPNNFPPISAELNTALPQQLRHYLQGRLPEYMVPSIFVILDALPVTLSGKLDYRALPAPDQDRPELQSGFIAPRTSLEELLAGIWANTLALKQVGIEDNFFQIGGHSLLVTQIIARVHETLHIELPLRVFFETPTIAALAEYIEMIRLVTQDASSPNISHPEREEGEI